MVVALTRPGWPDGNLILSVVPPEERRRLLPHLESVELRSREVLFAAGSRLQEVHFPLDCVLATYGASRDGSTTQYAFVGSEGFIGLSALFGDTRAVSTAVVVYPGRCYRLPIDPIAEAFQRSESLRRVVLRCASSRVLQTAQTSLCNAHHPVEQRLCRWLLQALDRVATRDLRITHELIATLLGVRREAVTLAAHRLQARKAVSWSRGHITVLDRRLLEALACECYALLKNDTELLVRDIGGLSSNGSHAK
jgi:CRP-like cAMP-binding protein